MATVTYSFVVRITGDPTAGTGLTPTFLEYRDIESLTDLSGSAPTIVEVGNGHYKFSMDWDTVPESTGPSNSIAIVIDADAGIGSAQERYITARINRTDNFGSQVSSLFQIETGKWEVVSNQLKIYESDGLTLIKTFNLFDATGNPTSTIPARREPV